MGNRFPVLRNYIFKHIEASLAKVSYLTIDQTEDNSPTLLFTCHLYHTPPPTHYHTPAPPHLGFPSHIPPIFPSPPPADTTASHPLSHLCISAAAASLSALLKASSRDFNSACSDKDADERKIQTRKEVVWRRPKTVPI